VRLTATLVRRGMHLFSPLLLLYYLAPDPLAPGVPRTLPVVVAAVVVAAFEGLRLALHVNVPGLRDYERHRLAAYAWGGFGLAIGFVLFPPVLHVVTFCGMAWIDPLCEWSRERNLYPRVPLVTYFAGALVFLALLSPYHTALALRPYLGLPLAVLAALVAVAAEYPKWTWTDDDFLMNIAPLAVMTFFAGF
jgi:hypothetical protein